MGFLLGNVTAATMTAGYGLIDNAVVAVDQGRVLWVGPEPALPPAHAALPRTDGGGCLVTPGLIDAHTHLVHAGHRAAEWERRLQGVPYAQIAREGGGILSTVRATRAASEDNLVDSALPRLDQMIATGTTTVEVKSGYGLTIEDELKMLRAARRLAALRPVHVTTTHLAAHAIPPDYAGRPKDYIADIALPSLNAAHAEGLVDAVDAFCETIAFSTADLAPLFDLARDLGLPVKLHAEQLSDQNGAAFAADRGALSCDHIEYLSGTGIAAMARAGTVATLLPGAFYFLHETQKPPVKALRDAGIPMALATDLNPGSSPLASLPLTMNMACTLFRLTPEEALLGTTAHAARALGLPDRGTIAPGQRADMILWDARHPAELSWRIGAPPILARIFGGVLAA